MRVPIYASDLQHGGAFKKLARYFKTKWPGQSPIQLMPAYEVLSRGLGYLDYLEVRTASSACHAEMPIPSQADVSAGIAAEVSSFLKQSNDTSVSPMALERYVDALPVRALTALKERGSKALPVLATQHLKLDLSRDLTCPVNDEHPASEAPIYSCPAPVLDHEPTQRKKPRIVLTNPPGPIAQSALDAIKNVVENSDDLRHKCILALFETGLRGHVIAGAKVLGGHDFGTRPALSFEANKTKLTLPVQAEGIVQKYIASQNLAAGDYLFPLKNDRDQSIPTSELLKICRSWEAAAGLPSGHITPTSLRWTFVLRNAHGATDRFREAIYPDNTAHDCMAMSKHYVVDLDAKEVDFALKSNGVASEPLATPTPAAKKLKDES
ncbi:hypothetical protein [Pseudomonas asiatica]|uniref:hypothetical protein n=1 Tax=Pseudomonas asiatica TaxID=2219225 RepID=UPI0025A4C454|nr:hypothetical protein [Pseudomonas asiatica]WJN48605.1 hypothetical protein QUR91_18375 [Pseudomonas asiatica]